MARTPARKPAADAVTPAAGLRRTKPPAVGKSFRVKSAAEVAELLSVSRNTVQKWIRDGMPTEGPEPGPGKPYQIDLAVAVRWLQEQAVTEGREDAGPVSAPADGGEDYDTAKTRRARADADAAEASASMKAIEEAEKRAMVAPIGVMLDMVQREYSNLAAALAEVGPRVEESLSKATPQRIGKEVDRLIRKAIGEKLKGQPEIETAPYPEAHHEAA